MANKIQHNLITIAEVMKKDVITQKEKNDTITLIQASIGGTQLMDTVNSAIAIIMDKKVKVEKSDNENENYRITKDDMLFRKNVKGEVYAVMADEENMPFDSARTGFGETETEAAEDLKEKIAPKSKTELEALEDDVKNELENKTDKDDDKEEIEKSPSVDSFSVEGDAFTALETKSGTMQYRKNGALISKDDYEAAQRKANGDVDPETEAAEDLKEGQSENE